MLSQESTLETKPALERTTWFREAGWGLFIHYLAAPASSDSGGAVSAAIWNDRVDRFDVDAFVRQVQELGAGYVIFSLGQNSGHYCAPNPVYDELTGIRPSKCSRRDLPGELAQALGRQNIGLILYLPSGAPEFEPQAVERLGWRRGGPRHTEFQRHWESIMRYWAEHYGTSVQGWWIDGCYGWREMYAAEEEPNAHSLCRTLRAGNENAILGFNTGPRSPVASLPPFEDYTAGELNNSLPVFTLESPGGGKVDNVQMHAVTFLGEAWGRGRARFSRDLVSGFTEHQLRNGGVVSWDVPIRENGTIADEFISLLGGLRELTSRHRFRGPVPS